MYENNNPHSDNESGAYRYTPERGTQSECIPGTYTTVPPEPPEPPKKLATMP